MDKISAETTKEATDITPVQLELWRESYTCTSEEVDTVLAEATSSPTATASATAEPLDESVPVDLQAEMAYCDMRQFAKNEGLSFREVESEARTYMAEKALPGRKRWSTSGFLLTSTVI